MSVDQFLLSANTTDLNYPEIRPSLDLNFARTKTLDPRIDFTRASGGSYVGADGLIKYAGVNEARFDHDPVTGESLGLLVEVSKTNLLTYSENFFSNWALNSASLIPNDALAPDGTFTANRLTGTNIVESHFIGQGIQMGASPYTFSCFIKAGSTSTASLFLTQSGNNGGFYDLSTGTVLNVTGTGNTASIQNAGNGWWRCIITNNGSADLFNSVRICINDTAYTAKAAPGSIYIWGAQVEAGAFPTSYIPTQGSTRTRAADNASITGKNFSDFYNQQNSTLFISGRSPGNQTGARTFGGIVDTSVGFLSSIYFAIGGSPNVVSWSPITGFSSLANYTQNTEIKGILSYTTTEPTARCCLDGGPVLSSFNRVFSYEGQTIFGFSKTMNRLTIGSTPWNLDSPLNGTVSRMTYFPVQLSNSQLQALTR